MKSFIPIILLAIGTLLIPQISNAAPKRSKSVKCPPVVADRATGALKKSKTNGGAYRCYQNETDAKRDGYLTTKDLNQLNFSGWWRIRIKKVNDACGKYGSESGLVLFVQFVQNGDAIFADFCPGLGQLVGISDSNTISVSRTEKRNEKSGPLACGTGEVEITTRLQMDRILDGDVAYNVKLTEVRRCPGESEGMLNCATVFSGIAFPETHKIWPAVSRNTSLMQNACSIAQDRCSECHENLVSDPKNPD